MPSGREKRFVALAVLILFLFSCFTFWSITDHRSLLSRLEKAQDELSVSIGREAKQQSEYDEALSELPVVREKIGEISPLAEKAESAVSELKELRKQLRQEKKRLEKLLLQPDGQAEEEQ